MTIVKLNGDVADMHFAADNSEDAQAERLTRACQFERLRRGVRGGDKDLTNALSSIQRTTLWFDFEGVNQGLAAAFLWSQREL